MPYKPDPETEPQPQSQPRPRLLQREVIEKNDRSYDVRKTEHTDKSTIFSVTRYEPRNFGRKFFQTLRDVKVEYPSISSELEKRFRRKVF